MGNSLNPRTPTPEPSEAPEESEYSQDEHDPDLEYTLKYSEIEAKYKSWKVTGFLVQRSQIEQDLVDHAAYLGIDIHYLGDHTGLIIKLEEDFEHMNVLVEMNQKGCLIEENSSVGVLRKMRRHETGIHQIQAKNQVVLQDIGDFVKTLFAEPYDIVRNNGRNFVLNILSEFANNIDEVTQCCAL